jgi:hypothetical protein
VTERLLVAVEWTPKRAFASALEWPGWSRSAKTPELAVEALLAYGQRYEAVAAHAAQTFSAKADDVEIVEAIEGDASTAFGVPGRVAGWERRPLDAREAERRAALVAAAWRRFDDVVASAPEELRKGPRGGGRYRSKIVGHVVAADHGYSRELGLTRPEPSPSDRVGVEAFRAAMLAVLRLPSDGAPIARRWTTAYAARRIAWHALDHAWEIEDRTPG